MRSSVLSGAIVAAVLASPAAAERGIGRRGPHPLLAGGVDVAALPVERPQGARGGEPGARAAGARRRQGRAGASPRRGDPDGGERRHLGRPDDGHLDAQGGPRLVGRHAGDRRRRGLHLAVLRPPRRRLLAGAELRRRGERRGGRSAHRQGDVRGAEALSVFAVRRAAGADHPEGAVRRLPRRAGAGMHRGQLPPDRHRAFRRHRLQGERRDRLCRQPELPRPGEAGLRDGDAEGRRRCGLGGARGARDRRVRLRLERPGRARDPRPDARGRQGRGDRRLRDQPRAAAAEPDRPRPGAGRRTLDQGASAPVPDRCRRRPGAEPRHRPRDPGRGRLRGGRAGELQPGPGAGDERLDQQRVVPHAGPRRGEPAARRGRLGDGRRRGAREGRPSACRCSTRPRPTRCGRRRRR